VLHTEEDVDGSKRVAVEWSDGRRFRYARDAGLRIYSQPSMCSTSTI
jgi:hypothetical protein